MQIIISAVCHEDTEDIAVHGKTENSDDSVHNTEDNQKQARIRLTARDGNKSDNAAGDVNNVVDGVHLKETENRRIDKADDADDEEDNAENPCQTFNHRKRKEK